jgi:cytidylate kinase
MNVITISREMGSGGTALGWILARKLGFFLIDKDLILRAAQKAKVSREAVARYDQEAFNKAKAVLEKIFTANPALYSPLALIHFPQDERLSVSRGPIFDRERYLAITQYLLRDLSRKGKVILLGRGGQLVLADEPQTLHLRVIAPLETRVKRVSRSQNVPEEEARMMIQTRDRACARYLKHFYRRDWNDPRLYDLIINTERLSLAAAASMVLGYRAGRDVKKTSAQS